MGEILRRRGQIRRFQLDFVLMLQVAYRAVGRKIPLGEILVKHRAITPLSLQEALVMQENPSEGLTDALKKMEVQDRVFTSFLQVDPKTDPG